MTIYALGDVAPQIADSAWVADSAQVIGDVQARQGGNEKRGERMELSQSHGEGSRAIEASMTGLARAVPA